MPTLDDLLEEAKVAHGHLCAGQVLGVRLAMLGCARLGIEQPRGRDRKRLVTFVEIDRCATDAIGVVTGCRLGKRARKFRDWGKMAAAFVDLQTNRAIRIAARESSKDLARPLHPEIENKNLQQWPLVQPPGSREVDVCRAVEPSSLEPPDKWPIG